MLEDQLSGGINSTSAETLAEPEGIGVAPTHSRFNRPANPRGRHPLRGNSIFPAAIRSAMLSFNA